MMGDNTLPLPECQISSSIDLLLYFERLEKIAKSYGFESDYFTDFYGGVSLYIAVRKSPECFENPPKASSFAYMFGNGNEDIGQQLKSEPNIFKGKIILPPDGNKTIYSELKQSASVFSNHFQKNIADMTKVLQGSGLSIQEMTYQRILDIQYLPDSYLLETTVTHELRQVKHIDRERAEISFRWASQGIIDKAEYFTPETFTLYQQLIAKMLGI